MGLKPIKFFLDKVYIIMGVTNAIGCLWRISTLRVTSITFFKVVYRRQPTSPWRLLSTPERYHWGSNGVAQLRFPAMVI